MAKIIANLQGDLRSAAFYRFNVQFEDTPYFPARDAIVVPRTPTNDELVLREEETYMWVTMTGDADALTESKDCPFDKDHVQGNRILSCGGEDS